MRRVYSECMSIIRNVLRVIPASPRLVCSCCPLNSMYHRADTFNLGSHPTYQVVLLRTVLLPISNLNLCLTQGWTFSPFASRSYLAGGLLLRNTIHFCIYWDMDQFLILHVDVQLLQHPSSTSTPLSSINRPRTRGSASGLCAAPSVLWVCKPARRLLQLSKEQRSARSGFPALWSFLAWVNEQHRGRHSTVTYVEREISKRRLNRLKHWKGDLLSAGSWLLRSDAHHRRLEGARA